MLGRLRVVGVSMLKAERISCSGPKLSDAQTRNFEAIKHKYQGVPKEDFYLHLKECEFRFNMRGRDMTSSCFGNSGKGT